MARPARFRPPKATRPSLLRARLLARLLTRWERRVVVVTGGPGFGKTTLLGQAIAENELAPKGLDVWLSCEPDDEHASYLTSGLLDALGAPHAPGDPLSGARAIADAVWSRAPRHVALVLDDVHDVRPGSTGAELLARLVDELPENGHLVIGSRAAAPFPIARLVAQGSIEQIGEDDLRFTDDEADAFAELRGAEPGRLAETASWPALAELTVATPSHVVTDYLWDEVLGKIPPERRRLIAIASTLGAVDSELLTALTGRRVDVDDVFEGVPLVGVTSDGWRLVHPLWSPALSSELDAGTRRDMTRRAAEVLRQRGRVHDAFRLFADAEATDGLRSLIREACRVENPTMRPEQLSTWLHRVPAEMRSSADGKLLQATIAEAADPATAIDLFRAAAGFFNESADPEGELLAVTHLALIAFWSDDAESLATISRSLFELESRGYEPAQTRAQLARAGVAYLTGDKEGAIAQLDQIADDALGPFGPLANTLRSETLFFLGKAHAAVEPARRATETASPIFKDTAEMIYRTTLWNVGDIPGALNGLTELLARSRQMGTTQATARIALFGSAWFAFVGDLETARSFLAVAEEASGSAVGVAPIGRLALARAAICVATGDEAQAARHAAGSVMGYPSPRHLAFLYTLLPSTRAAFDADETGGQFAIARDLAHALCALREDHSLDVVKTLRWPDTNSIRVHLPFPWAATLAVAAIASGRDEGRDLLDAIGPPARQIVRGLTGSPIAEVARTAKRMLSEIPSVPQVMLEVRVLGPLEVVRDGVPLDDRHLRRERVRTLLLYLIAHPTTTREAIAAAIWPDLDPQASSNNLRVTLSYLLRVLEPDRSEGDASFFVRQTAPGGLRFVSDGQLSVDAWEFERLFDDSASHERQGAPSLVLDTLLRALELYRGPYLTDVPYADWAVPHRERSRRRFVDAVTRAGDLLIAAGRAEEAVDLAERAVVSEPQEEAGYHLLARAHAARGDKMAARTALESWRAMLADLGLEPDERFTAIERSTGVAVG